MRQEGKLRSVQAVSVSLRSALNGHLPDVQRPMNVGRPLKNIPFFDIELLMHAKNPPVLNGRMDFL